MAHHHWHSKVALQDRSPPRVSNGRWHRRWAPDPQRATIPRRVRLYAIRRGRSVVARRVPPMQGGPEKVCQRFACANRRRLVTDRCTAAGGDQAASRRNDHAVAPFRQLLLPTTR